MSVKKFGRFAAILLWLGAQPLNAAIDAATFETPEQEARYKEQIEQLRCLVCQNQNIADSNAELAQDLRGQVRRMILDGQSDDDISQFMVDRYGDFVLYDPPFRISTALLWVGPFVVLAGGLIAVRKLASGRKGTGATVSDNERNRAHKLLSGEGDK